MGRFDGKTEKATPQARKRARSEGRVARSQEIGVATSLLAGALALRVFGPHAAQTFRDETHRLLAIVPGDTLPGPAIMQSVGRILLAACVPFLAAAFVSALVAGFGQVGFKPAGKAAKPKLSHLSPKKGLQRLKPATAGWELVRSSAKLGLLVAIVWGPVSVWASGLGSERSLEGGLGTALDQAWNVILRAVVLATLIGAADYAWNRWRTEKELKMSKEDVRREHKDSEGDPWVRAARRGRARELSRNRMLDSVARAHVVVTNPTHFAVALSYVDGEGAPRVVAKGADRLAAKIRKIAYRNGILVTEDKPLARALYRRCKVGQFVPAALYEAVAIVLAIAYRRRAGYATLAGAIGSGVAA